MVTPAIGSDQEKYVKADFRRQDLPHLLLRQGPFRSSCLSRIEGNERELTAVGPSPDIPVLGGARRITADRQATPFMMKSRTQSTPESGYLSCSADHSL
jgi:hypothetical protein